MMATGLWQDTVYSACCFMGARCKAQRLRRNIDEIAGWPAITLADKWQPYLQDGQRVFPSREEAEYTASLGFWRCSVRFLVGRSHGAGKTPRSPFPLSFVKTAGSLALRNGCAVVDSAGTGRWSQCWPLPSRGCWLALRKASRRGRCGEGSLFPAAPVWAFLRAAF